MMVLHRVLVEWRPSLADEVLLHDLLSWVKLLLGSNGGPNQIFVLSLVLSSMVFTQLEFASLLVLYKVLIQVLSWVELNVAHA